MITKYVTSRYDDKIKPKECTRETELSVWYLVGSGKVERRQNKHSDYETFHDTWEAAHGSLLGRLDFEMSVARSRLESLERQRNKVMAMAKPGA